VPFNIVFRDQLLNRARAHQYKTTALIICDQLYPLDLNTFTMQIRVTSACADMLQRRGRFSSNSQAV
jgi:hypothetical protein